MSLERKYSKSMREQWSLRFKTKHPDGDNYDGVVTHVKPGFIVLREERDFEFDGLIVLPKRFILAQSRGSATTGFFSSVMTPQASGEKTYELNYDEILRIEIDSKYCNHFNDYMRARNGR